MADREYTLREAEFDFEKRSDARLFPDLDESFEGLQTNPINSVLSKMQTEYLKGERTSLALFYQLNEVLVKFQNEMNANDIFYGKMDIVKVFKEILLRYENWITSQRGLILLFRDYARELKKINEDYYSPNDRLETLEEEIKMQFNMNPPAKFSLGKIKIIRDTVFVALTPEDSKKFKDGQEVLYAVKGGKKDGEKG